MYVWTLVLTLYEHSHDEWVSQDRLRKSNNESRELAKNLKEKGADPKPSTAPSKKKAASSDLSSTCGTAERDSSASATTGQEQTQGEDLETKVGDFSSLKAYSFPRQHPPLGGPSREASPGLPGFPRLVRRNNSRDNRSPLHFQWGSPEPPAKRLSRSPATGDGKPTAEFLPSNPTSPTPEASSSLPSAAPFARSDNPQASSSGLSSAPPSSPSVVVEPEGPSRRRGRRTRKKTEEDTHEIFGDAILGSKFRSRNDPRGVHGPETDYPCGKLDNLMHHHLEYPLPEVNRTQRFTKP